MNREICYNGYFILSDLDGSLVNSEKTVSKENGEAIRLFQQNGGLFSCATGRLPAHFATFDDIFAPNAPVITHNGAGIYDLAKERMLYERLLSCDMKKLLAALAPFAGKIENVWLFGRNTTLVQPYEQCLQNREVSAAYWLKAVITFQNEEAAIQAKRLLGQTEFAAQCNFSRSWAIGLEILSLGATKGDAVRRLRQHFPQVKKIICIGDYENDLTMLKEADMGVAMGNAISEVKAAADFVTVTNDEHAIAAVIAALPPL